MMNRRGFLQGLIGGATGSGMLVIASQQDIAAFASPLGTPVTLIPERHVYQTPMIGETLYNAQGYAVARVKHLSVMRPRIETTSHSDTYTSYRLGKFRSLELICDALIGESPT